MAGDSKYRKNLVNNLSRHIVAVIDIQFFLITSVRKLHQNLCSHRQIPMFDNHLFFFLANSKLTLAVGR